MSKPFYIQQKITNMGCSMHNHNMHTTKQILDQLTDKLCEDILITSWIQDDITNNVIALQEDLVLWPSWELKLCN